MTKKNKKVSSLLKSSHRFISCLEGSGRYSPVGALGIINGLVNQVSVFLVLGSGQDQRGIGSGIRGLVLGNGCMEYISRQFVCSRKKWKKKKKKSTKEVQRKRLQLKSPVSATTVVNFLIWSRAVAIVEDVLGRVWLNENEKGFETPFYLVSHASLWLGWTKPCNYGWNALRESDKSTWVR